MIKSRKTSALPVAQISVDKHRQTGFSGPNSTGSCTCDGEGRRISKTENGVIKQYLYDGDFVLLELNGSGAYLTRNLYGRGEYLGRTTLSGTPQYMSLLLNGHGDVMELLASDGVTRPNKYDYDAFGNFTQRTETAYNNIYYAQQEYDELTGNYHMGARYYAPGLGRFITADSWTELPDDERGYRVGGFPFHFNLYAYALDNPLIYVDPSGHREAVGTSQNDEEDTAEGTHVWAGDKVDNDYDRTHAERNLDNERKAGIERGNKTAKQQHDKYWKSVDAKKVSDEVSKRLQVRAGSEAAARVVQLLGYKKFRSDPVRAFAMEVIGALIVLTGRYFPLP